MKKIVKTDQAPSAIGPYSQAVGAGGFLFISGQIPVDPSSGNVLNGSIGEQTKRVIENIYGVLRSENMDLTHVVKTTIFLTDMDDFGQVNAVYSGFFKDSLPARACIEAAALPKGVGIEMDAIAFKGR